MLLWPGSLPHLDFWSFSPYSGLTTMNSALMCSSFGYLTASSTGGRSEWVIVRKIARLQLKNNCRTEENWIDNRPLNAGHNRISYYPQSGRLRGSHRLNPEVQVNLLATVNCIRFSRILAMFMVWSVRPPHSFYPLPALITKFQSHSFPNNTANFSSRGLNIFMK